MNFIKACLSTTCWKPSNKVAKAFFAIAIYGATCCLSACNKADEFYLEGQNINDLDLEVVEDSVLLQTERQPHIQTTNLEFDLLGTFNDPVTGRSTASVYTQVRLVDRNPDFGTSPVADSLVAYIKLEKNALIGQLQRTQTIKVYELVESLQGDKYYFSDTVLAVSDEPVATYSGALGQNDSVLKISFNPAFAQKFLTAGAGTFGDNTSFSNFLKGLYIVPDSTGFAKGEGAIVGVNLANAMSKMVLYYRKPDAQTFTMNFSSPAVRINIYNHNFNGTEAGASLAKASAQNDKVYLQSMGGLKAKVTFPGLYKIAQKGTLALHRAEIIFPRVDSTADTFNKFYPKLLFLRPRAQDGGNTEVNFSDDASILGYFDGTYHEADKSYHFIITRYMQDLLTAYAKDSNYVTYGINISIPVDAPVAPTRAVLAGNKYSGSRPKIVLTYTKLGKQ